MDKMIEEAQVNAEKHAEELKKSNEEKEANLVYTEQRVGEHPSMVIDAPFTLLKQEITLPEGISSMDFRQYSLEDGTNTIDFVASAITLSEGVEFSMADGLASSLQSIEQNPNIVDVSHGEAKNIKNGDFEGKEIKGFYYLKDDNSVSFTIQVFIKENNSFQIFAQYDGLAKPQIEKTLESLRFE